MNRTKIEWTDYTWNPITGCKHGCPYCYARKIAMRFKKAFPDGFEPTFHPERLTEPIKLRNKPSKIFTVSMGDMFGDWVPELWHRLIYNTIHACPYHQFQILTKAPHNIHKNIKEWPKNTWIGTSLTGGEWPNVAHDRLRNIRKHNGIRFVSFEPLLNDGALSYIDLCGIDWVIIGAQTNPTKIPDMNKIEKVVTMADKAGAKVFIKNNILDGESGAFCWPRRDFPVIK